MKIDLKSDLTFKNAFLFPIQNTQGKYDLIIGALLLLIPVIGWILNMGHRIAFVHNMQQNLEPWPAWCDYKLLFKNGLITLVGMIFYYIPGSLLLYYGSRTDTLMISIVGGLLLIIATIAIPGFMSHFCKKFNTNEIFNPLVALSRVFQGGRLYWKAWAIALSALVLSFLGLILFGFGFLFTSVWFWQVAGYSFANVFSNRFKLIV